MDNVKQQISLIYNTLNEDSSSAFIDYMISHVLRLFMDYDDKAGKKYFATDQQGIVDLRNDPRMDIIMFENIGSEESEEALRLVRRSNKGARFFVPLGSDFIGRASLDSSQRVFTYSLKDHRANFYAYRIDRLEDGSVEALVSYQPDTERKRGLMDRLFTKEEKGFNAKFTLSSGTDRDVLNVIQAFAFALSLGLEPKYVQGAVEKYDFGPASQESSEDTIKTSSENRTAAPMREKEIDFD